jgi:hypothetical protein
MSTAKRPVKSVTSKKNPIKAVPTPAPVRLELSSYPIDELMNWRNAARVRADERSKRLLVLKELQEATETEIRKLDKKQHSDLIWIGRLQRTLSKKVLG